MSGIRTPVEITQIRKFEKQNCEYSVNVYALDEIKSKTRDNKAILFPLYNTKERNRKHHANLLLVTSGDKRHYVVIKSLSRLLKLVVSPVIIATHFIFVNFVLYSFSSELLLDET